MAGSAHALEDDLAGIVGEMDTNQEIADVRGSDRRVRNDRAGGRTGGSGRGPSGFPQDSAGPAG